MSIFEKNGDSDYDQMKKFNFFLEDFSDFERDYKKRIAISRTYSTIGHSSTVQGTRTSCACTFL